MRVERLCLLLCFLATLLWSKSSDAQTIGIARPHRVTPNMAEAIAHLHGELLAVGLDVEFVSSSSAPMTSPPELLPEGHLDGVLRLVCEEAHCVVEIWQANVNPAKPVRVQVVPGTQNASQTLAIRAIEVLRSHFLERQLTQPRTQPDPTTVPTEDTGATSVQARKGLGNPSLVRWGLGAGVTTLTSLAGVGPAVMPLLQIDLSLRESWALQATGAGFGSRPVMASEMGSAELAQEYAVLGARYRFRRGESLQPFVALAAGVLSTSIEGRAEHPRSAHAGSQLSLLLQGSSGAELHLTNQYSLSFGAHVQFAEPSVAVYILDKQIAIAGSPNLALTLAIGAWL